MNGIEMYVSIFVFAAAYALIVWDRFDRAAVALTGALLMVLLGILKQEKAFAEIDFNTIGLLIGMMIIVTVIKRTGIFEYCAVRLVKLSRAEPLKIMFFLSLATGLLSAFLDNVTTIILILPVTMSIARDMRLNPIPYIISEVFASNLGGAATLIGDPPNIIIGSAAGLGFTEFLVNVGVLVLPLMVATTLLFMLKYGKELAASDQTRQKVMAIDEKRLIKDKRLLIKSLVVLGAVILAFMLHGTLKYDSATVALSGAAVLLIISGVNVEHVLHEVEWKTILFFAGLFILVGGIKETGFINLLSENLLRLTKGNLIIAGTTVLWGSAIFSAFLDNIPFVTTMTPLIKHFGELSGLNITPLWWALSLGACLGGNGTIIGASANVIAAGMAEELGCKITFKRFFKDAFPMMLLTIAVSTIYLYIFYFR